MKIDRIMLVLLVIISILTLAWLILYSNSEGRKCLANPYIYGASKMKNIDCSCVQLNNPICPARFYFNDTSFTTTPTTCGGITNYSPLPLNFNITK